MQCQNANGHFDIVAIYLPDERNKETDNRFGSVGLAVKWKDVKSFNVRTKWYSGQHEGIWVVVVVVKVHSVLSSTTDGGEWPDSSPGRLSYQERAVDTCSIG